jgi:hypothetical protein
LSAFALFFLISALPWTTVLGQSFKYLRQLVQSHEVKQDWTTGPASEKARRLEAYGNAPPARGEQAADEHAEHAGHAGHSGGGMSPVKISGFGEIAALIAPLRLADSIRRASRKCDMKPFLTVFSSTASWALALPPMKGSSSAGSTSCLVF